MPLGRIRMRYYLIRPLCIHMGRPWQLRNSHSSETRCQHDQTRKKLLYCQWTKQHQSVSIRGKERSPKFSVTNQCRYTRLTTIPYMWLSTLVDSIWFLEKEWDSQEEHNTYNTTSLTANYSYTNLSHPIQITLTQKHLTTSTWIMNSIKEPNWIIYSSKAQRCSKAPRYNF